MAIYRTEYLDGPQRQKTRFEKILKRLEKTQNHKEGFLSVAAILHYGMELCNTGHFKTEHTILTILI